MDGYYGYGTPADHGFAHHSPFPATMGMPKGFIAKESYTTYKAIPAWRF